MTLQLAHRRKARHRIRASRHPPPQSQAYSISEQAQQPRIGTAAIVGHPTNNPRDTAIAQIRALMTQHGIDANEL